jgi:hypothetical protein
MTSKSNPPRCYPPGGRSSCVYIGALDGAVVVTSTSTSATQATHVCGYAFASTGALRRHHRLEARHPPFTLLSKS